MHFLLTCALERVRWFVKYQVSQSVRQTRDRSKLHYLSDCNAWTLPVVQSPATLPGQVIVTIVIGALY